MFGQAGTLELINCLDGSGSDAEYNAVKELRMRVPDFPKLLLERYRQARKWQIRASCLYHAIRHSRTSENALQLGVEALMDRSAVVRYRACMLLAYSLKTSVLPDLKRAMVHVKDKRSLGDFLAAVDAITHQNSNYFVDRNHSGDITLNVM